VKLKSRLAASSAALTIAFAGGAQAADATSAAATALASVDSVIVTGQRLVNAIVSENPGGTSVVAIEQVQASRVSNISDALRQVPGLFAQSAAGGEATRLSIRGSGISKGGFTYGNGVQVLFDGFPITTGFGTPYESFEPNALQRVEVYKGANAFEYGPTQLGGVINFVQNTGKDTPRLFVRAEAGSYGYHREQISTGGVAGKLDYYATVTNFGTNGYLRNTSAESTRVTANAGYQITPNLSTRFYFSYAHQDQENVSSRTLSQLLNTPRDNPYTGKRTNPGAWFIANRTNLQIAPNSSLEVGVSYKRPFLYNGNLPQRTFWRLSDIAAQVKYRRTDTLFGDKESRTTVALIHSRAIDNSYARVFNVNTGATLGRVDYDGSDTTVLVSNDFALTPRLWLDTGIAWIRQERENYIRNAVAAGVNPHLDVAYEHVTPRIGLRYDLVPAIQLFANVSSVKEAPQIISYTTSVNGVYTGYGDNGKLTYQSGTSYEIGTRGSAGRLRWDVALYRSRIKNELLTVFTVLPSPAFPNGVTATTNAAPTIHQGIEASVEAKLLDVGGHRLSLTQSYTLNDFRFADENLAQGRGRLPGLPQHVYQAGLRYDHESGLYAIADLDAVLKAYPIDYVNQQFAPSYALVGLTLGFSPPGGKWRVFVQGQNLTDERYASFTSATFRANAASAAYTPGVGRTVSAGVSYAF